jgi:hypothetical protein
MALTLIFSAPESQKYMELLRSLRLKSNLSAWLRLRALT